MRGFVNVIVNLPSKEKIVIITIVTLGLTSLTYLFFLAPHNLENFWRTFWDVLIFLSGVVGILELIISVDFFFRSLDGNSGLSFLRMDSDWVDINRIICLCSKRFSSEKTYSLHLLFFNLYCNDVHVSSRSHGVFLSQNS